MFELFVAPLSFPSEHAPASPFVALVTTSCSETRDHSKDTIHQAGVGTTELAPMAQGGNRTLERLDLHDMYR